MAQIKKDTSIRKAILQAAITGQLISDTGGESLPLAAASRLSSATPSAGDTPATPPETGKQLLDRIIEERNKKLLAEWEEALKTNTKAKKPAPVFASKIDEDEIPFEIPENWCWCRLGDIFTTSSGTTPASKNPSYYLNGSINWVRTTDLNNDVLTSTEVQITEKAKEDCNLKIIPQNSVCIALYGGAGTIGKNALIKFDTTINQSVCAIHPNGFCSMEYIQCFMQWQRPNWMELASGSRKDPNINQIIVKNCLIPLPPLAVQNAIVAKLEQVLPLVDAYENAVLQKEELKSALPDKVKKAILQEAITGKLTESWRKSAAITETGQQLLDRIILERNAKALAEWEEAVKQNAGGKATSPSFASKTRAKKPVPVTASEIDEDEIPFEIPESWCWCRLGEICNEIKRGKSPKYVVRSDYLAFAQKCNVKTGEIDLGLALYLDEKTIDRYCEEDNLIQGDVVINSTGGGTMGRVGYYETKVPDGIKGVYPDSHVTVIRSIGKIDQRYLYYVLKHNQPVLEECGTGSTNQTELKPAVLANLVIPLPSLEEQKEIVKKVEKLLPLCK